LRRDAPIAALAQLLVPENGADQTAVSHRLVWALFADGVDRKRDFLWRQEAPGRFMILSARPPVDPHNLFDLQFKPFAPVLSPGDRLGFTLRANAVIARPEQPGRRGKHHDVVMDLLRQSAGTRAEARPDAILVAGRNWLARQGDVHGFVPSGDAAVDGYDRVVIPRSAGRPAVFGVLDITGVIEVKEPDRFLAKLAQGFGRARAFGCGLMLIRRTR
jgi:CRISPR system Cascade subunit CasE